MSETRDGYLEADRRFAERLKDMRIERGWSQEALATKMVAAGVPYATQSTVSRIENKSRPVRVSEVEALLSVFRVPSLSEMTSDDPRVKWLRPLRQRAAEGNRKLTDLFDAYGAMREYIPKAQHDLEFIERMGLDSDELPPDTRDNVARLQRTLGMLIQVDVDSFLNFRAEEEDGSSTNAAE